MYLICKAETARNQEPNPRRRLRARPPRAAQIRASTVCGQAAARARLPLRRAARGRAAQTFLRPGPLGARRGLRASRLPHLAFAAQLPEELLILELASLVGHDARHLPALRPRRPAGLRACAAPAGRLRADRLTAHPRRPVSGFPLFQAPARVGSRSQESEVPPPARTQPTPPPPQPLPTARANPALAAPSCRRRHFLSPPTSQARPSAPPRSAPPLLLARPPAPNSGKQNAPFTTLRPAPRMRRPPACGAAGLPRTRAPPVTRPSFPCGPAGYSV